MIVRHAGRFADVARHGRLGHGRRVRPVDTTSAAEAIEDRGATRSSSR